MGNDASAPQTPPPTQSGTRLPPAALFRPCDPSGLGFKTSDELTPLDEIVGQRRAVDAVRFGLDMRHAGYNVFAVGAPGTGKQTVVEHFTRRLAREKPRPSDWAYVFNFAEPHKPRALELPPGRGVGLRQDMRNLIEELRSALPAAFESDNYRTRRQVILDQFREEQQRAFAEVEKLAKSKQIAIIRTPMGVALAPMKDGEVLPPEQLQKFTAEQQEQLQADMNVIHEQLQAVLQRLPEWESQRREKIRELNREVTRFAIGHLIDGLAQRYTDLSAVVAHLKVVEQDLVDNAEQLLAPQGAPGPENPIEAMIQASPGGGRPLERYAINLVVDHSADGGAPVIEEDHPALQNLIGRVEHRQQFGALVTDFTLIKGGALHQANGGYLIIDARRILMQPFAWEELKRTLRAGVITIRSIGELTGLMSTVALEPEPIPLRIKIVLVGDRMLHYLLTSYDPDFVELFKVTADFDDEIEWTAETEGAFARLIAGVIRQHGLRPFRADAVARVIEYGARIAGDRERITGQIESIADLLREADHHAGQAGAPIVHAESVVAAVDAQIFRASRVRDRIGEEIRRGTIMIANRGERIGQVNGLSVFQLGGFAFGRPSRITARVRLGKGEVVDIEREVELGGPLHSKGVMILAGFLGGRFGRDRPLSLSASLVFEQSYGGVEGDSASMAELCAILSALAEVPIRQRFALTGSVNQHGEAQAIGGVNEKIEGFFDVCAAAGLVGDEGVIIPASNAKHLMLRRDVVEAVAAGRFQVHGVTSVDEAFEILTGLPAGVPDVSGRYTPDSLNGRVDAALAALADRARTFLGGDARRNPS